MCLPSSTDSHSTSFSHHMHNITHTHHTPRHTHHLRSGGCLHSDRPALVLGSPALQEGCHSSRVVGLLDTDEGVELEQLVGALLDEAQVLQHVGVRDPSTAAQHLKDGTAIAPRLVEEGLDTWGWVGSKGEKWKD